MREHDTQPMWDVARPSYAGLTPRGLVAAVAALAFAAALAAFALAAVAVGVLLLIAAALLAWLYLEQADGSYVSSFDRLAATAADRSRALGGVAGTSVTTWTGVGRELVRLRLEARSHARDRSKLQYELGGACFAGDAVRTEELRERMRLCNERIDACTRRAHDAVAAARARVAGERLAAAQTQVREPVMGDPGFEPGTSALSERRSNQLS